MSEIDKSQWAIEIECSKPPYVFNRVVETDDEMKAKMAVVADFENVTQLSAKFITRLEAFKLEEPNG